MQAPEGEHAAGAGVRAEDLLLVAWVAIVSPAIVQAQGPGAGLFAPGRPVEGALGAIAIAGAAACLGARRREGDRPEGDDRRGLTGTAAVGPFVGGLLLVVASTAAALGLAGAGALALAVAMVGVAAVARAGLPPLSTRTRRLLVAPYVLVAAGLFWTAVDAVGGTGDLAAAIRGAIPTDVRAVLPALGFLAAFSGVYYAMLVYAPRQVAEREGGAVAWLVRFGLFFASVLLGASWLLLLGG